MHRCSVDRIIRSAPGNEVGWCRRLRHASKAQTPQDLTLTLQVFQRVVLEYVVSLQEFVDLVSGFKSEEPPQIVFGESATLVLLGRQRFQSAPRQIATSPMWLARSSGICTVTSMCLP